MSTPVDKPCPWCEREFSFREAVELWRGTVCPECKQPVIYVLDVKTLKYSWQKGEA